MTRPSITPGPFYPCSGQAGEKFNIECKGVHNDCIPVATLKGPDRKANSKAFAALPELLAALESALESLQQAVHPLRADGATGAAEDCEDSAALITAALTKAGYTFP